MAESENERFHTLKEAFFTENDDSKLPEMFAILDRNGNGVIEAQELRTFFAPNASNADAQEELNSFIQAADTNKNGVIDFTEFSEFFKKVRKEE